MPETETTTRTLAQFIADYGITMTAERTDTNPYMDEPRDMDHWKVKLTRDADRRHRLTTYFSMGYAHKGKAPTAADVLSCLASDVSDEDFESWCRDLGFDADSRKAERIYLVTQRQTERLKRFLGDAFDELVYHTERE